MNPRKIGVEWRHDSLPLTLWIYPGKNFGRLVAVESATLQIGDTLSKEWKFLFLVVNAFVLDYEWSGDDDSQPLLVDYLEKRNLSNPLSTLEDFLLLSWDDVNIAFDAYQFVHPSQPSDDASKKKQLANTGLVKPEHDAHPEHTPEPVPTS